MQNENLKASHLDVMPAVAGLLSDLWFDGEFKKQPEYLLEIFEIFLETEDANSQDLRLKMLSCIRTSRMVAKTLEPFTDIQIEKALKKAVHV